MSELGHALTPVSFASSPPVHVGAASCASTSCHGSARSAAPVWQRALSSWLASDPHPHAYRVLWTFRARTMTESLEQRTLSDGEHLGVLQKRCVGCHATPSPDDSPNPASYDFGVTCESCHGPAGNWLYAHQRTGFARDASPGFVDTKDLAQRAAVCLPCHIGPSNRSGRPQAVDHDLIAAGHPRLNFEIHAYFHSLPPHWDRNRDEQRHPGSFHFQSWLTGQKAQAEQLTLLVESTKPATGRVPLDFAWLDCTACHHQLAAGRWRQAAARVRSGASNDSPPLGFPPLSPRPVLLQDQPNAADLSRADRLRLANVLLARTVEPAQASWDSAVSAYLAVQAIVADFNEQDAAPLAETRSVMDALGGYLARDCFLTAAKDGRVPTIYDSPDDFTPAALAPHVLRVREAITKLQTAQPAAP